MTEEFKVKTEHKAKLEKEIKRFCKEISPKLNRLVGAESTKVLVSSYETTFRRILFDDNDAEQSKRDAIKKLMRSNPDVIKSIKLSTDEVR